MNWTRLCAFLVFLFFPCWLYLGAQEPSPAEETMEKTQPENLSEIKETEGIATEDGDTVATVAPVSEIEEFYRDPGFQLFPSSRILSNRNTLRNELFYNSNVFQLKRAVKDDTVYVLDFQSEWKKRFDVFEILAMGGIRVDDYFRNSRLDEVLPRGQFLLKYEDLPVYGSLNLEAARLTSPEGLELRGPIPTHQYLLDFKLGVDYKNWLAEHTTFYRYTDFRNIRGDNQQFGQNYLVGHQFIPRFYGFVEYGWTRFDYLEAGSLPSRQEDTIGHHVRIGARFKFDRRLTGDVAFGVQFRDSQQFFSWRMGLTWDVSPRLQVLLQGEANTFTSTVGDFQTLTRGTLGVQYLLTPALAIKLASSVAYVNPDVAETQLGYRQEVTVTYRIYKGIDAELFYRGNILRTDSANGSFDQHLAGGAIQIVF